MELSHKHQVFLTVSIVVVMFIIILLLMGPAIQGNNIVKDFKEYGYDVNSVIEGLKKANTDVRVLEVKQESCEALNSEYVTEMNLELFREECKNNLSKSQTECLDMTEVYKREITKLESEIENQQKEYELIIQKAANNICCKYKVDFPNTDSYFLSNSKIVCATGEDIEIEC